MSLPGVLIACWALRSQAAAEPPLAHGLGTARWFVDDLVPPPARTIATPAEQPTTAPLWPAVERGLISKPFAPAPTSCHRTAVSTANGDYEFGWTLTAPLGSPAAASTDGSAALSAHSDGSSARRQLVVLLHGFLGAPADWTPVAQVLSPARRALPREQVQIVAACMQLTGRGLCASDVVVACPFPCPCPCAGSGSGRSDVCCGRAAGLQRYQCPVSTRT